ncbi:hypothetical protein VPH35_018381 [Triticum aestivum]
MSSACMGTSWTRRARRDRGSGLRRGAGRLDLVAQIAYVRGGSAGRERGDVGSAREGHDGRGDEEVAKDLRGGAEVATARGDNRGRCVARRHSVAAAMADTEAAHGERLVLSGSSGASGARGTCEAPRDVRRVSPAEKELGVCAGVVTEHGATGVVAPGRVRGLGHGRDEIDDRSCNNSDDDDVMA